ncbi:RDD family protein [Rasiella rasia]|uniref:RDD family protein n=1 Tax=Rasiella rasia TaxID=2744027 RepID=UPI0021E6905E|nr:RDD family protein [Rasiella rasia]
MTSISPVYANLPQRIKAACIDAVVLIALMYAASEILSLFENVSNWIRIVIALFLFVLYEPLLVSIYGETIGHFYSKISVEKDGQSGKKISFTRALARFICKFLLGWISLLTVTGSDKKQAIHDHVANSVVVERKV